MMIIKKRKAVIAAILSAALTVSAAMPAVSAAGTRTKAEKYGDSTYATRFLSLYDDVITNGQANGYLSTKNVAPGGFGIPYHCVEELNIEAPDNGHETTSEAMSYIVWMAAMRDYLGTQDIKDADGNTVNVEKTSDLAKAWKTMEMMIPTVQTGFMSKTDLSAQYSEEHDTPEEYPSSQDSNNTGHNPLQAKFSQAYSGESGLYLMHWLADVDDWYGYGGDSGQFTFINTFQRGAQESCWETVPHACVEELKYGMVGTRGIKGIFSTDSTVTPQWSYTNAPDAEDRAIQAVYAAKRWGVVSGDILSKAGMMGDQLRNNMFDKYYKKIGACNPNDQSNNYDSAHYLMSWYTSWGGANDGSWAWQIGASHCHEFYQNPLAAYALLADPDLKAGMKVGTDAVTDYTKSLQRQLEFYLWLQSEQGPIAGGATSSWHGRYLEYKYLPGVDQEYIDKYGTDIPTTFYDMAYQEHPVYADPGSNHWIGNQVWAIQRLAELYYDIKTNPTDVSNSIKAGGLSMEDALAKILDRWVEWFVGEVELTADGDYTIPATLDWFGQPKTWNGTYQESTGVTCEVTARGSSDLGCVSSLCNTLIYYAKANGVETEAAYSANNTSVAAKGLYTAHALLDREWALGRDDIGVSRTETNGSMYRLFEQKVHIPEGYNGTMPNGDTLAPGATFLSIRSKYNENEKVQEFKAAYDAVGGASATAEQKTAAMETVELSYHRFWHAGDILLAMGTMAELYPDLQADKYDDTDPNQEPVLSVDSSIEVGVGETADITSNVTGSTFESADSSIATVDSNGTVTGVAEGTTTITVKTPGGQTATVTVTVTDSSTTKPTLPSGALDPDSLLYGDVDLDGKVSVSDVTKLYKYLASSSLYPVGKETPETIAKAMEQADVAWDNKVDSIDGGKLIEYCLSKITLGELGPQ
ncbi:MAG: glycoside hydrolase family 48 protein [Porcipelethomonas sp.]